MLIFKLAIGLDGIVLDLLLLTIKFKLLILTSERSVRKLRTNTRRLKPFFHATGGNEDNVCAEKY